MFTLSKLSVPRDRVRASFSESQDWETEEDGVSMDFDMTLPLQGSRLKLKRLFLNWKCEILKLFWEPLFVLVIWSQRAIYILYGRCLKHGRC